MESKRHPLREALERRLLDFRIVFEGLDSEELEVARRTIAAAERVFVGGMGRTGAIMDAFANRLARRGRRVHGWLDCTAPPLERGDLFLIGSGSGSPAPLVAAAEEARQRGATVFVVTTNALSPLGRSAEGRLILPPLLPPDPGLGLEPSLTPLQRLFEQSLFLVLDGLADLMESGARERS